MYHDRNFLRVALPLLAAVLALFVGAARADLAHDIARGAGGRYKGSLSQGDLYCRELYEALTKNRIEAYLIQFEWTQLQSVYSADFVVFRDGAGRYFGQSSTSLAPKWLSGRSPERWAQAFCSDVECRVLSVATNRDEVSRASFPTLPATAVASAPASPVPEAAPSVPAAAPAPSPAPVPVQDAVANLSPESVPARLVPIGSPAPAAEAAPAEVPTPATPLELAKADAAAPPPMAATQPDSAEMQAQEKPMAASDLAPPDLSKLPPPTDQPPAPADSPDPMINLLNLLQQRGVISANDSAVLIKQAEAKAVAAKTQMQAQAPALTPVFAASADAKDVVHVTYVPPAVRAQIAQEVRDQVMAEARDENWANPRSFPNWLSRITLFGDVRIREEADLFPSNNATGFGSPFWNMNAINTGTPFDYTGVALPPFYNNDQNRERVRLRARFGLDSDLGDGFSAGFRIATGQDDSPVSENQSIGYANNGQGGNFSKYAIWLDRAFITYDVGRTVGKDLSFTVGRFDNPFFGTTMIWADDLGFDGFVAKAKYQVADGVVPFATAGLFPVYNTDFNFSSNSPVKFQSEDKWLYGAQVGVDWKINDDFSFKAGTAVYWFQNIEGKVSSPYIPLTASDQGSTDDSRPAFAQRGNTYIALRDIVPDPTLNANGTINQWQYFGLATPFHEVALTGRLDYSRFDPFHLWLVGEGVKNVAFDRNAIENNGPPQLVGPVNNLGANSTGFDGGDTAWIVSMNAGSPVLQKRWDWNVGLSYRYVESDAVVDGFCDSDFGGGGTNLKGFTLGGNVALSQRVWLGLRWMSSDSIAGPRFDEDLVQFDINAKF